MTTMMQKIFTMITMMIFMTMRTQKITTMSIMIKNNI